MSKWIPISERLPEKAGVYLVTILNREWNEEQTQIVNAIKPKHDEFWEHHANLYAKRSDGKWVHICRRVFHDSCWSGYGEIVIAWAEMPEPYAEVER